MLYIAILLLFLASQYMNLVVDAITRLNVAQFLLFGLRATMMQQLINVISYNINNMLVMYTCGNDEKE